MVLQKDHLMSRVRNKKNVSSYCFIKNYNV